MLFFQLFYTFLLIGAFTFGGGYSMVALIQREVVTHYGWLTAQEFTDMLAVSQMTPGPVGINTATYAGYTAVLNAGYPVWAAVAGSLLASLAVVIVPVSLVMIVGGWLLRHRNHPTVASVMVMLRLAVIGLIAAAALSLLPDAFSTPQPSFLQMLHLDFPIIGCVIFAAVFFLSIRKKVSPIFLILASGLLGLVVYGF